MRIKRTTLDKLVAEARAAAQASYAPHSGFQVGAAVLCADETVVRGCNVENDSYGLTICAERNALFAATALGHRKPVALAVTCLKGDPTKPETLMPCGACRQVMLELLASDAIVVIDRIGTFTLPRLLPKPFRLP